MANAPRAKKGRRSHRTDPILKLKSIFFLSIQSKKMPVFCIILCILLAILIGSVTVYFTAHRPSTKCELTFKRTMKSSLISSSKPRSVAVGDLDHDHQIDFVVANSGTDNIGVFISRGNGTFANQRTYSTGSESHPRSLAISDFNNDTYSDIVVANYDTNNIGLFLGYGNGTFKDQNVIPIGSSHPLFVTTGDFNKDNQMDIAVVNNGTNTISILLGYGNGSFQDQIIYFTGYDSLPSSLAVGDFNNDTYLDIVVTNSGTNNIGIFLNYGNGTFTNQEIYTTTLNSKPSSVALCDLNNDNMLDIAVANYDAGSVGIFFGHGNGTFLQQQSYPVGSNTYPQYITVSDLNKDNTLYLIIVDSQNDRIHVLPGYRNGSFATLATYDVLAGSAPVYISVTDLNNNNQLDIVVANHDANNIVVLMDYFAKPSVRVRNYREGESGMVWGVSVSDLNNDGISDIIFLGANYVGILIGPHNSSLNKGKKYPIDDQSLTSYACTGDLNNDNRTDIIIADIGLDSIVVFFGYGNGSLGSRKNYSTGIGSHPWWVTLGDINHDHILDIISANTGSGSIGIQLGNGNETYAPMVTYSTGYNSQPGAVVADNVNNDNNLDIVVVTGDNVVIVFLGQIDNTFIIMARYSTGVSSNPLSIAIADFNDDNYVDIAVANIFEDNVGVLLGYGNGTFSPQTSYSTGLGSQPYYVIVEDFNNDNISDITVTNFGTGEVVIFYGYGNGSFELGRNYSTGPESKPYGIVTADLDNDSHLEFVVALFGTGDIAILTEYYAAEFANKRVYPTGSARLPTSVAIGDFNNDNRSDIVVANFGRDSLDIVLASNNGTFQTEAKYFIGTDFYPQYVITCDINKDKQIDIVSVNSKNNSISVIKGYGNGSFAEQMIYSTGDDSLPSAVVGGDVNNDNRLDLVVANSGTDSIGIFYGYDYTSFQAQQPYKSIDNLSPRAITVGDFNNDNILDLAATFDDSHSWCIFLGHGNGNFTIARTYLLANGSSPVAIGVGDFNNDNQSDIVIANYGTDTIVVYLNYRNASFHIVGSYSTGGGSGPKKIAFGDFNHDNQLDIVVAHLQSYMIELLLGYGNGSFITRMTYLTGENSSPVDITVADFNNDGRLDIAVANYYEHNIGILLAYPNGTFANHVIFSSGYNSGPSAIIADDFNRDNQLDIATANYDSNSVGILLGYGNGSFASVKTYLAGYGSLPQHISSGDFNNDNISDIAVANYGTNNIIVLFGVGDGSFLLGTAYSTGTASLPFALGNGDFNNDSRLDIAVANSHSNTIGIFLGDDSQPFAGATIYPIGDGSQPHSVALGDFNNDSLIDIVVINYGTDSIEILFQHDGTYSNVSRIYLSKSGSDPYSVAVSDFNNDTYLDMVVSNSATDNIVILLGNGMGKFINRETHSTGIQSRPYTVAISDFNNDNILDIAVANSGTSNILLLYGYGDGTFGNDTFYHFGYEYQPHSIAVGYLNEDDRMDIAIACYGTDHVETLIQKC